MLMPQWVRLPSDWIRERKLRDLRWAPSGQGSDNVASLMALTAIAHTADQTTGISRITYDELGDVTRLSRSKLSNGLDVAKNLGLIDRAFGGRSRYRLSGFDPKSGWAKFPAKAMYEARKISAFEDIRLRQECSLHAMKLFFLFVAFRDNDSNLAKISYTKIEEYSGVARGSIKSATALLASIRLTYVEAGASAISEHGISNSYRVVGIEPYIHMGTRLRGMPSSDFL